MAGIPQYSDSIIDVPISQELFNPIFTVSGEGSREYCTGYYPTLIQIDSLYVNAQKISWTEDPNIEKHTAPGRDGDILHHLGWHSRTVRIDAEISGTSAGDVIATLHKKSRTKSPVKLTISTPVDKSINGMYVIESFNPSSSTRNPINTADYSISLLSHTAVSACGTSSEASSGNAASYLDSESQRNEGSYTNDDTEGCEWCRSCEDSTPVATCSMMQSVSNMSVTQWPDDIGEATEDYQIINTFSSNDPLSNWCRANLGNSNHVVIQKYTNGYLCYNRTNCKIGWINNGAIPPVGTDYTIPQSYFDDEIWHMICQWHKNKIDVYTIKNWNVHNGIEIDLSEGVPWE